MIAERCSVNICLLVVFDINLHVTLLLSLLCIMIVHNKLLTTCFNRLFKPAKFETYSHETYRNLAYHLDKIVSILCASTLHFIQSNKI